MGEIEVNEYVRTDKGYIFKVDEEKKMIDEDTELIHVRHVKQQKKRSSLKHIR